MSRNQNLFLCLMLGLSILFVYNAKRPTKIVEKETIVEPKEELNEPEPEVIEPEEPSPKQEEPTWTSWPKVRSVNNLGKVLSDIESHMPAGHIYRDNSRVTWAHETTHGINANIRNSIRNGQKNNAFYVLEDRAAVIVEPRTTIRRVAGKIPQELRGPSYQLYLVESTSSWNNEPLYIMDEWTAYTNGSACGRELNADGWYYELLQAHNFNVYSMYLMMTVKEDCPDYDDKQLKAYIMWNVERTFDLAKTYDASKALVLAPEVFEFIKEENHTLNKGKHLCPHPEPHEWSVPGNENPTARALAYSNLVKTSPAAEKLRVFARDYFGKEWCQKFYGF